jgi:uncharacterized protein (TIGR00255 family)
MKSMTGFGRGTASGDNFRISVDIKTVNNRFLDVNFRLTAELQEAEGRLKKLIGERLARGRVDINLTYEKTDEISYDINRPFIKGYLAAMMEMRNEFSLQGEPDLNALARLPNALIVRKDSIDSSFNEGLDAAVDAALSQLDEMRSAEGKTLKSVLQAQVAAIESRIPAIVEQSAAVAEEYQQKLTKRMGDLLAKSGAGVEIDPGRMAQEIAYLSDRSDISEEIDRLSSHIDQFRTIIDEENEVGKRLDFLTQEFNREANTIASKTQNMIVKENALAIKSEIEKMREQVQNIE